MKKTGASVCSDALVCNKRLNEFSINSASGIIYDLLYFKLILCHGGCSFQ